jgi:hypothetical protein
MGRYSLRDTVEGDVDTFDDVPSKKHPDGKTYTFVSPSAKVGLYLTHMVAVGMTAMGGGEVDEDAAKGLVLDDDAEKDLYKQVMGDTLAEMLDDDVPWSMVQRIFQLLCSRSTRWDRTSRFSWRAGGKRGPGRTGRRSAQRRRRLGRDRAGRLGPGPDRRRQRPRRLPGHLNQPLRRVRRRSRPRRSDLAGDRRPLARSTSRLRHRHQLSDRQMSARPGR